MQKKSFNNKKKMKNISIELKKKEIYTFFNCQNKCSFPHDTKRSINNFKDGSFWEEIKIFPQKKLKEEEKPVLIDIKKNFPQYAFSCFISEIKNITKLNLLQSLCFETAYKSNENMLICSPTGSGKTNVALIAILNEVKKNFKNGKIKSPNAFKIVYIAPMKALVEEIVEKLKWSLQHLGLVVSEYTGDIKLSKKRVSISHLIVTTPEKWDIITRKAKYLIKIIRLLIIDEIHILHDDRGAILETIVARTLRMIESTQKIIRIIGLSATLPNYKDVATFLRVNHDSGLVYLDQKYRPVPIIQNFIGIKPKFNHYLNQMMNDVCWYKTKESIKHGHQVIIFVHSKKETLKTIQYFLKQLEKENKHLKVCFLNQQIDLKYKNKKRRLQSLYLRRIMENCMGIHHAGMPRQERNLIEYGFNKGYLKVLCTTATLAWGINLPARRVIIKGTKIYNSKNGDFTDISFLDITQIFGRAGRPQFDNMGEAYIICNYKKLNYFLALITNQLPIESRFREVNKIFFKEN